MSDEKSSNQSFNINGSTLSGGVQIGGVAGGDIHQQANQGQFGTVPSQEEVVDLFAQLKAVLNDSDLSDADKQKAIQYVDSAQEEAQGDEPDKEYALKSFQKATKVIKAAGETAEATSSLWNNVADIAKKLAPWFGVAAKAILLL